MSGGLADALVGEGAKSGDSQICMMLTPRYSLEGGWPQILVIKMNWGAPRAGFARGVFHFSLPRLGAFLFLLISRSVNYRPDAAAFALSACTTGTSTRCSARNHTCSSFERITLLTSRSFVPSSPASSACLV